MATTVQIVGALLVLAAFAAVQLAAGRPMPRPTSSSTWSVPPPLAGTAWWRPSGLRAAQHDVGPWRPSAWSRGRGGAGAATRPHRAPPCRRPDPTTAGVHVRSSALGDSVAGGHPGQPGRPVSAPTRASGMRTCPLAVGRPRSQPPTAGRQRTIGAAAGPHRPHPGHGRPNGIGAHWRTRAGRRGRCPSVRRRRPRPRSPSGRASTAGPGGGAPCARCAARPGRRRSRPRRWRSASPRCGRTGPASAGAPPRCRRGRAAPGPQARRVGDVHAGQHLVVAEQPRHGCILPRQGGGSGTPAAGSAPGWRRWSPSPSARPRPAPARPDVPCRPRPDRRRGQALRRALGRVPTARTTARRCSGTACSRISGAGATLANVVPACRRAMRASATTRS